MNEFITIGTRICNLSHIDDISYDFFEEKKISIPPSDDGVKVSWVVNIMYESGNVVSETVLNGQYGNDDELVELQLKFVNVWAMLIACLTIDTEDDGEEVEDEKVCD